MDGKDIGDTVKSSDATLPEGTQFVIDDSDFTIATLSKPKTVAEEEAEEAEGEEGAAEGEEGAEGEAAAEGGDEAASE